MDWARYKRDVEDQRQKALDQIAWMKENNVTTRQKRGVDQDWTDTTAATLYENERIVALLDILIKAIEDDHLS